jgi:hypothetical protein
MATPSIEAAHLLKFSVPFASNLVDETASEFIDDPKNPIAAPIKFRLDNLSSVITTYSQIRYEIPRVDIRSFPPR